MRVLLIIPPLTQLNTPYPSTGMLAAHLRSKGVRVAQADAALELVLRLFSAKGLRAVPGAARYRKTIDRVVRFLQGSALSSPSVAATSSPKSGRRRRRSETAVADSFRGARLAREIVARKLLPEGPRFSVLDQLELDEMPLQERAKYLASLYIDDLADLVAKNVDPRFALSRYAETLAASAPSFASIRRALEARPTPVDGLIDRIAAELVERHRPDVVGLTIPFPGNVYGAFRIARAVKSRSPGTKVVLGGGYVSTELRELSDPRVFDYADFVILDDGEKPMECLIEHLEGRRPAARLLRTFLREKGQVVFRTSDERDVPHARKPAPTTRDLPLGKYVSLLELPNPMHRLWSDGRWNKLLLAHGCYWRKCSFCDTSLDYIGRFEPAPADVLVDRIEAMVRETGERGFHFTDEAAPPALLRTLAGRLIARRVRVRWWCNIRFEKQFTPELARRLAASGCIAVTGGLEAATDRLLRRMRKGVTVAQAARAMKAFADAGILVHAYLMYGFPTQTAQDTIDGLENVRRLFAAGCLQSAFWHRFALTAHSPMARDPKRFGIRLVPVRRGGFARNEIPYTEPAAATPARRGSWTSGRRPADGDRRFRFGPGLRKAVYNYMHGVGLDADVRMWFDFPMPRPRV